MQFVGWALKGKIAFEEVVRRFLFLSFLLHFAVSVSNHITRARKESDLQVFNALNVSTGNPSFMTDYIILASRGFITHMLLRRITHDVMKV